jgi:hypothetical protein
MEKEGESNMAVITTLYTVCMFKTALNLRYVRKKVSLFSMLNNNIMSVIAYS